MASQLGIRVLACVWTSRGKSFFFFLQNLCIWNTQPWKSVSLWTNGEGAEREGWCRLKYRLPLVAVISRYWWRCYGKHKGSMFSWGAIGGFMTEIIKREARGPSWSCAACRGNLQAMLLGGGRHGDGGRLPRKHARLCVWFLGGATNEQLALCVWIAKNCAGNDFAGSSSFLRYYSMWNGEQMKTYFPCNHFLFF